MHSRRHKEHTKGSDNSLPLNNKSLETGKIDLRMHYEDEEMNKNDNFPLTPAHFHVVST